jgi:hypothetical protein
MRIIVCGDRHWDNFQTVDFVLNDIYKAHGELLVIEGGAKGADAMGLRWAKEAKSAGRIVDHISVPADWKNYGRAAGPIRNAEMLDLVTDGGSSMVVAFHLNIDESKGTKNMVGQAEYLGVPVMLVNELI